MTELPGCSQCRSVGCIAAELFTGVPLFPGKSQVDQLQLVLSCFSSSLPRRFQARCLELSANGQLQVPAQAEAKGLESWM